MTLVLDNVAIARSGRTVLAGLSRTVRAGQFLVVTGSAGTGKSSLLHAIAGHLAPAAGSVSLAGRPPDDPGLAGGIGFVGQAHELVPTLTATENVALAVLSSRPPREAWQQAVAALDALDLPRAAQANLAEELSGGQHQRVALARALSGGRTLVVADDPTSELDVRSVELAIAALHRAAAQGTIIVVATAEPLLLAAASAVIDLDDPDGFDDDVRSEA